MLGGRGEMHGLGAAGGNLCPLFPWVKTSTLSPGEICGHLTPIGILFPQHAHLGLNQEGKGTSIGLSTLFQGGQKECVSGQYVMTNWTGSSLTSAQVPIWFSRAQKGK